MANNKQHVVVTTNEILDTKSGKTLDRIINKGNQDSDKSVEIIELNITERIYWSEDACVAFSIANWNDVKDKILNYITNGKTDYIVGKIIDSSSVYYIHGLQFTLLCLNNVYDNVAISFLYKKPSESSIIIHCCHFSF